MNRDIVAAIPGAEVISQLGISADVLVETEISDAVAGHGTAMMMTLGGVEYLGGSAFNVARVLGLAAPLLPVNLQVQFFGLAGRVGADWPHLLALETWSIGHELVERSAAPPASCLAMVEGGGRTLLTALGANTDIAAYLMARRERLIAAFAECELLHITSFLHPEVPRLLAEIIGSARELNPELAVSLDPGAAWVGALGEGFRALLAETDILHLNAEESLEMSARCADGLAGVGRSMRQGQWMVVSRSHAQVSIYRQGEAVVCTAAVEEPIVVVDATGAGDSFCGGFLAALIAGRAPIDAAEFGFALARHKVQMAGPINEQVVRAQIGRGGLHARS